MGPKSPMTQSADMFRQPLQEQINLKHSLVRLAALIDWQRIETVCAAGFSSRRGRPG
jgi:IS5 family transposase